MSQSEVDRFVADLKEDAALRGELTGAAAGVASVVTFAQAKGYDITADEARDYIQGQTERELSDADLEAVAGGKGHHHSVGAVTEVAAVQTVAAATTEATVAETTAEAVAEVGVVAVAAIVAT